MDQKGFIPQKIFRSNAPLDDRERNFQDETKQQKAYLVKSQKMPSIELVQQNPEKSKIGSFPSDGASFSYRSDKQTFRDPQVTWNRANDTVGKDENLHDQFVKKDTFDSPAAFH